MRPFLLIVGLPILALSASVPKGAGPAIPSAVPQSARVPVLVELFTSEACTICPAAGDMLRFLEQRQPIAGVEVIGMEMPMDAWTAQGMRDPFALRQMTNRQNEYLRLFKLDNLLTPQMVIGGQAQLAVPDAQQAKAEIARVAKNPRATVNVLFQSASVAAVQVDKLPASAAESEIWLAVAESDVVRSLAMLGMAQPGELTTYSMHLRFNPRWRREDLKYVVFVQERISRKIWGATAVAP